MDVTEWLRGVGLERYAPAFRDNDVDGAVLRRLTGEDLRELGVASIGHRRRLLDAIAVLDGSPPAGQDVVPAPDPRAAPPMEGERRQLTVMFCDLVGSTSLSTALDPEDLQAIISAYQHCVTETIQRFDGFVARYMGDGILAYFGYPHTHEDDAERAMRSGLAAIEGVARLDQFHIHLAARIGIATGLVVVGDSIGVDDAQETEVVGETPHLAARLQAIAQPNTIVIADRTRNQVGAMFEVEDLGPLRLKGFGQPQRAWRVIGETGVLSRFEALRSEATPLVGRDEELGLLRRRWLVAKAGEGRVVLVSGEPGIGKSRLTQVFSQAIRNESHTRLRYFCSPYGRDSALHPFIAQLERAAGWARDDAPPARLAKLETLVRPGLRDAEELALLAELLSLEPPASILPIDPRRKRERLFEALFHQLEAMSRARPVLMVVEDAHWMDPTSRELLDLIVERVTHLPVMLVVTFRPELQPTLGRQSHVTTLVLTRLSGRDGATMVKLLAGDHGLARDVVDEIVDRADGVPLFVEELTKAVLESGESETRAQASPATGTLPRVAVPATVQASLLARLDRLGAAAKDVAQVGALLGREFSYELIRHVARRPDLDAALAQLAAAGLLFCSGVAPHATYLFKHALLQDAAYGTLLRATRQELHARTAAVLEQYFPDLVERQPEILAYHLAAAGETERALDQWLKAGQHAAARSAHTEAISHFDRGLAALATLPEGPARDDREIALHLARGPSVFASKGFAAPEAARAYARACELAEERGDGRQLFMAVNGLWQSFNGVGMIRRCRALSSRLQDLTEASEDDALRLQAHHSAWATCLYSGEPAAARDHCEAGRRLYDPERHRLSHQFYGGHDPGSCARYLGAQAHWLLGYPETGLVLCGEGLALAEKGAHPFSYACALQYKAMIHLERGEAELALQWLEAAEAYAAEQRLGFALEPQLVRGAALTAQGVLDRAVACLREGLGGRNGAGRSRCFGLARLADALIRQGEHGQALAPVRNGLATARKTGHRQWQAELHRLEGVALFGLGQVEDGQAALKQAMRLARRQQAKAYELRAAASLARLWGERGRRAAARDLLAPVYAWFTEGFETADLKDAKVLLDHLA